MANNIHMGIFLYILSKSYSRKLKKKLLSYSASYTESVANYVLTIDSKHDTNYIQL